VRTLGGGLVRDLLLEEVDVGIPAAQDVLEFVVGLGQTVQLLGSGLGGQQILSLRVDELRQVVHLTRLIHNTTQVSS